MVSPSVAGLIAIEYPEISVLVEIVIGSESGLGDRQDPDVTFATIVPEVRFNPVLVQLPEDTVVEPSDVPEELGVYNIIVVPFASDEYPLIDVTGDVAEQPLKLMVGLMAERVTVTPADGSERHCPLTICRAVITWHVVKDDTFAVQAYGAEAPEVAVAIWISFA